MAGTTKTTGSTQYDQAQSGTESGSDASTQTEKRSSVSNLDGKTSQQQSGSREANGTQRDLTVGKSVSVGKDIGASDSTSQRVTESKRDLLGKTVQTQSSQERANVAYQITFTVPIRSVTPTLPGEGSC